MTMRKVPLNVLVHASLMTENSFRCTHQAYELSYDVNFPANNTHHETKKKVYSCECLSDAV